MSATRGDRSTRVLIVKLRTRDGGHVIKYAEVDADDYNRWSDYYNRSDYESMKREAPGCCECKSRRRRRTGGLTVTRQSRSASSSAWATFLRTRFCRRRNPMLSDLRVNFVDFLPTGIEPTEPPEIDEGERAALVKVFQKIMADEKAHPLVTNIQADDATFHMELFRHGQSSASVWSVEDDDGGWRVVGVSRSSWAQRSGGRFVH